jgi:ABC-type transport system involved in cytochrome c biogenesis ATPase subunit
MPGCHVEADDHGTHRASDGTEVIVRALDIALEQALGLVIQGEAGIGKTSLWRWAARRAETRGPSDTTRST